MLRIREYGHSRIAAIHRNDAAAGVRASAAEIHTGHGRSARKPIAPHILRQTLSLEDVASGQADFFLDIRRAEHLGIDYGIRNVTAEARQSIECMLFRFVAMRVPGAL